MGSQIFLVISAFYLIAIGFSVCDNTAKITDGWRIKNVDDEEVKNLTNLAVEHLNNNQTANDNQYKLLKINEAKFQLVSGKNFLITFQVGLTNCKKNTNCPDNAPILSTKDYSVLIYNQPWTKFENYSFTEQLQQYKNDVRNVCPSLFIVFAIFLLIPNCQ